MVLSQAIQAGSFIIQSVEAIHSMGSTRYKPSDDWNEFVTQIERLHHEYTTWMARMSKQGYLSEEVGLPLIAKLNKSLAVFQAEERRLRSVENKSWFGRISCFQFGAITFPSRIKQTMQDVVGAYAYQPVLLISHGRLNEMENTENRVSGSESYGTRVNESIPSPTKKASSLFLRSNLPSKLLSGDSSYVPFKISEAAIFQALENVSGPRVVVVHGGPGRGKSVLARAVALHYANQTSPTGISFDQIIFLQCGPRMIPHKTQNELLRCLGGRIPDVEEITDTTPNVLRARMKAKSYLVILDDVWQFEHLQQIVELGGDQVRFLITSRKSNLLQNSVPIEIQASTAEEARKIFANHVPGVSPQKILKDQDIQDVSKIMIRETRSTPLALASLAMTIRSDRVDDMEEWQNTAKAFSNFLKLDEMLRAPAYEGHKLKGLWATMKLVRQSLPVDAQILLALSAILQGPYTPEVVVKLLYGWYCKSRGCNLYLFSRWRSELKNNGSMLVVEDRILLQPASGLDKVSQKSWSLHELHKGYVRSEMRAEVDNLLSCFIETENNQALVLSTNEVGSYRTEDLEGRHYADLQEYESDDDSRDSKDDIASRRDEEGSSEDEDNEVYNDSSKDHQMVVTYQPGVQQDDYGRMISLLFALYVEVDFTQEPIERMRLSSSFWRYRMRSGAVELILEILPEHDDESDSAQRRRQSILKVFLTYVYSGELDDDGLPYLLSTSESFTALVTSHVLQNMASTAVYVEKRGLVNKLTTKTISALATLLEERVDIDIQISVLQTFAILAVLKENHDAIISTSPDILEKLIAFLGEQHPTERQMLVCVILTNLTQGYDNFIANELPRTSLKELVRLLSKKETRLHAMLTLTNIARTGEDLARQILDFPGVVSEAVSLLSCNDSRLQEHAAEALAMLGRHSADNRQKVFQQSPSCVSELLKLITGDHVHSVQIQALLALNEMENGRSIITGTPKCLSELLQLLSVLQDQPEDIQIRTLEALAQQALVDEKTASSILNAQGAIADLVAFLSKSNVSNVQSEAAKTLAFLAKRGVESGRTILRKAPECLNDLVHLLSKQHSFKPQVQLRSAEALADLAFKNDEASGEIFEIRGALKRLCRLLRSKIPSVHGEAARALGNLADAREENGKRMIMECPKLMSELVRLIDGDREPRVQVRAVTAIASIAFEDPEISTIILETPGAVESLLGLLSKKETPDVQEEAARALANIASDSSKNSSILIRKFPWCVRDLVRLLSSDNDAGVRSRAVEALAELSSENEEVASDILECPQSVWQLTKLLSDDGNSDNQYHAARVLANLVCENPENVKKITLGCPTCVTDLVSLITKDCNPDVVYQAAGALGQLALVSLDIATKILEYPTVINELAELLTDDDRLDIQLQATEVLSILATSSLDNRLTLVRKAPECVSEIVRLLKSSNHDLLFGAVHLLVCLAHENVENATEILKHPEAVKDVVCLLMDDENLEVKEEAIKTLALLASSNPDNCKLMVLETPEFVLELVRLVSRDQNSDLLYQAGETLAELALSSLEVATKILEYPGVVEELTWLLSNHDRVDVRLQSAVFLSILASSSVENGKKMLIQYPECVTEVLRLISERQDVQYGSVHLLACLSFENVDNSREILSSPGALEELVGLLTRDENPDVQEEAARTLAFLADSDADHGSMILEECPDIIMELARLVSFRLKHVPDVQLRAVEVLTALGSGNTEISSMILDTAGTLKGLTGMLSKSYDGHPKVQEAAATCLAYFASDSIENANTIFKRCSSCVADLVRLISDEHDPRVQRRAAEALAEIAPASHEIAKKIMETADSVNRLVKLLAYDDSPEVQEEGARALANLASENRDNGEMMVLTCPKIIEFLARLASDEHPADVQQRACEALANLAFNNEAISYRLVECAGAVKDLISLVANSTSSAVQEAAARTMRNLASVDKVRSRLASAVEVEALDALVEVLNQKTLSPKARYAGVVALTMLDSKKGDAITLDTKVVYKARGCAKKILGLFSEALVDFDSALQWDPNEDSLYSERMYVKAMLEDYEGALVDANKALQLDPFYPFYLQERGVLKIKMGDWIGALEDLNKGDGDDYKTLKHRGHVKFLLKDDQGARADAVRALRIRSSGTVGPEPICLPNDSLACSPVKYLDFELP